MALHRARRARLQDRVRARLRVLDARARQRDRSGVHAHREHVHRRVRAPLAADLRCPDMNGPAAELQISVAWITPHIQDIVPLRVKPGTTVGQAIAASGLLAAYAIDATTLSIAVAGKRRPMDALVADG